MGVALEEARAGSAPEDFVEGLFDLGLALHVGLVEVVLGGLLAVDFGGDADIAEEMGCQRPVDVVADGAERDGDTGKIEVVLAEAGHGLEVEILPVDKGYLRVVAIVDLELAAVVVACQSQLLELRDDRLVHDLHDVRLLLEGAHPVVEAPVFPGRDGIVLLLPGPDDVGEVELDLHAGAVLHQGNPVAVADLAADRGEAHGELGVPLDAGLVIRSLHDLHIPHPAQQEGQRRKEDAAEDQQSRPCVVVAWKG